MRWRRRSSGFGCILDPTRRRDLPGSRLGRRFGSVHRRASTFGGRRTFAPAWDEQAGNVEGAFSSGLGRVGLPLVPVDGVFTEVFPRLCDAGRPVATETD
jgi:hypothetical protein